MKFILDGYNVIGKMEDMSLSSANKESTFIDWLRHRIKKGMHVMVIFDGQNEFITFPTKEKLPGITVIHTSVDQTADDYIKENIFTKSQSKNAVVVTSDRDILYHAKQAKVKGMSSEDFLAFISKEKRAPGGKKSPRITERHMNYWLNEFDDIR